MKYSCKINIWANIFISGDIEDEDEVLAWLTDEDTLEIPGKIEEVNSKMLEKILEENDHIVVFFCKLILLLNSSLIILKSITHNIVSF